MTVAPIVVFAIGNPSRGDDALGPCFGERLVDWLTHEGRGDEIELIDDFQLQVEHAVDLQGRKLALFVDAGMDTPAPFSLNRLHPANDFGPTTHAISPGAVLQVYARTLDGDPPAAFVLCIRGESFELGAALTVEAATNLEAAFREALLLLVCADVDHWQTRLTKAGPGLTVMTKIDR
ncbi:MAG: hydrogenase maturation protease [Betaproteobacteria bacterium]